MVRTLPTPAKASVTSWPVASTGRPPIYTTTPCVPVAVISSSACGSPDTMGGTQAGKRGPAPLLRMSCERCCEPEAPAAAEAEPRLAAGTGCQIASARKGTVSLPREGRDKRAADFKFRLDQSYLSKHLLPLHSPAHNRQFCAVEHLLPPPPVLFSDDTASAANLQYIASPTGRC